MTRQTKTPRQRAEEALAVAERRHGRASKTVNQLRSDLLDAENELAEAKRLHDYAKQHPALQQAPTTTSTPNQEAGTKA